MNSKFIRSCHAFKGSILIEWTCVIGHNVVLSHLCYRLHPIDLNISVSYFMNITLVLSTMSLSCLIFMIDNILSDQSCQFSFDFGVHHTYTINHVVVLSGLHHRPSNWSWQLNLVFNIERICTIGHIIVLSYLHHKPHIIRSILNIQYCIQRKSNLYDQSCHCPVCFSW